MWKMAGNDIRFPQDKIVGKFSTVVVEGNLFTLWKTLGKMWNIGKEVSGLFGRVYVSDDGFYRFSEVVVCFHAVFDFPYTVYRGGVVSTAEIFACFIQG